MPSKVVPLSPSFTITTSVCYPAYSSRHRSRNSHNLCSYSLLTGYTQLTYPSRSQTSGNYSQNGLLYLSLPRTYHARAKGSLESIGSVRAMHERANAETADNSDFSKFQKESKALFGLLLPGQCLFPELRDMVQEQLADSTSQIA